MPSFSSCSAALMPGQVDAILIRTRSRRNARLVVLLDNFAGLLHGPFGVEGEPRVHLGRNPAGNDGQNLLPKGNGQVTESEIGYITVFGLGAKLFFGFEEHFIHYGLILWHPAAAVRREGLVVVSWGLNFSIDSKSPVSATTTVISLSCSSSDLAI